MFKQIHWRRYLPYALVAAVIYCVPVVFFIRNASYTQSWLLFLGNILFLFVIATFLFSFNRRRHENASSVTMLAAGEIVTVMGIVISVLLCILMMILFIPGLFNEGHAAKVLTNAPDNTIKGNTGGLVFEVIADAIVGNMSTGSFASILFPFALKGDQTKDDVPVKQKEL